MKKLIIITGIIFLAFVFYSCEKNIIEDPLNNTELKSGKPNNNGFDEWGFNWNAHHFNGYLVNMMLGDQYFKGWPHYQDTVYRGEGMDFWEMLVDNYYLTLESGEWHYFPVLMPYQLLDTKLNAHWNDNLISKEGDYPNDWIDSDGWISFKYSGKEGNKKWSHYRKLIARKSTDYLEKDTNGDGVVDTDDGLGIWYNSQNKDYEIGFESMNWPELIVVQVINTGDVPPFFYNEYISPWGPGYGKYKFEN